jgi:TatD DNase family protein
MRLIDTHAHIYLPEFDDDRADMLERAEKQGLASILMPAIDSGTHNELLQLETSYPNFCRAMMGLHPCSVKAETMQEELNKVEAFLRSRPFVAIGEIGIDLYWDKTNLNEQREAFEKQIGWALELDLPIAIHSREATDECIGIVSQFQNGNLRGVFHCFSGTVQQAEKILAQDFYLGIGGVISFKNAGLDTVLEQVPVEKIILETDSPYLAPVPFRGKRNEPSYLTYIAEKLATLKDIALEEIEVITTLNAKTLFNL